MEATEAPFRPNRYVGTSLKMYFDMPKTTEYIRGVGALDELAKSHNVGMFVIPDFLSIVPATLVLRGTNVTVGAQDCYWEDNGAYTGEVSPMNLFQAGVKLVEIGHAERRRHFGETDETIAKKVAAASRNGLIPLICIGERTHGKIASEAVGLAVKEVRPQVTSALAAIPNEADVVLAYEPVWAIGAKEPADPDHVVAVTKEIRKMAEGRTGGTRILYGGSAGPGTFAKIAEGVDGLFLGRFAHDLENLKRVIEEVGTFGR